MKNLLAKFNGLNKKLKILVILCLVIIVLLVLVIATHRTPKTLEQYADMHPSVQQDIDELEQSGVKAEIDGNTVTYTYDTQSTLGDVNITDDVKSQLQQALESSNTRKQCKSMIKSLEDKTDIDGIRITMVYKYGNDTLASKTYK